MKAGNYPAWVTGTEFCDQPTAAAAKLDLLTALLYCSTQTVVYTGPGVSTAAGVRQV